ncbi:MAG: MFS transporter [Flavipsychrobacter sp.]|nr:MFS transporter [Flavipsychrobacter sp.]
MSLAIKFLLKNRALRYPLFRNYLLMRVALILSLHAQITVVSYMMYQLTKDALSLGMMGLAEVIPAIGFSMVSGHFVDINEKRGLLMKCIAGYVLLSVFYLVLSLPSFQSFAGLNVTVWMIYGGVFIGGILRAFVSPSAFALMGQLVPRKQYPNATTWSSTAWQAGSVLGPLVGGFLLGYGSFPFSLGTILALQVIPIVAVLRIPRQPHNAPTRREPITKSLAEGLNFVVKTQVVLSTLALDMFAVLFGGAVALLPVFAEDILKTGEIGYGWMRAAPGIGTVLTLMILSFAPLKKKPGLKLFACIAGFGVTTIVFGLCGELGGTHTLFHIADFAVSGGFLLAFSMLLIGGALDGVSVVIRGTILQLYTPDHMRGRVAAVNTMFISSSNELGAMESGLTAKLMGTVPAVVFGGCMTLVVVGVTYVAAPMLRVLRLNPSEPENKT